LIASLFLPGCNRVDVEVPGDRDRRDARPNVLLVTIDTLRADRVGAYGDGKARTPVLDRLAGEGTRFAHAFAAAPITLPSHASILTGAHPPTHGVRHNGIFRLGPGAETLAERLRASRYTTGAVVGSYVLDRRFGLDRGFSYYDDEMGSERADSAGFLERSAERVTSRATRWLARSGSPFFLWVHYYDPHHDYRPPAPFDEDFGDDLYAGEVAYVDASLGQLIDALRAGGRLDDTIVAVTSDHGESLGEHGEETHTLTLYDATLAVPLVFRGPGVPAGRTVEGVVRGVDVAPTILALLGLAPFTNADGLDLAPTWRTHPSEPPRIAYAETLATRFDFGWSPLFAVRSSSHLYVRAPRPELYDIRFDPFQRSNLLAGDPVGAHERVAALDAEISAILEDGREATPLAVDVEVRDRLRALGYALAEGPVQETGLDPKDGLASARAIYEGVAAYEMGESSRAERILSAAVEHVPRSSRAHAVLAMTKIARGDLRGAAEHAETAVALTPESAEHRALLGDVHRLLGSAEAAAQAYAAAARIDPTEPGASVGLMWLCLREGDVAGAERHAKNAFDDDPTAGSARLRVGQVWEEYGESERALDLYQQALTANPGFERAAIASAILLARLGRREEADSQLARAGARALDPQLTNNLGIAFAEGGDVDRAERIFRRLLADDPGYAKARRNLAFLLRRTGREDEAARVEARTAIR
jgi:arylsulfatase A-like enzyme/Tfp pilus assembly protein PilF